MDILRALLSNNTSTLISSLVNAGFSEDQAQVFLPEACGVLVSSFMNHSDEKNADLVLRKIDFTYLASRLDMDTSLVIAGMKQLVPHTINALRDETETSGAETKSTG